MPANQLKQAHQNWKASLAERKANNQKAFEARQMTREERARRTIGWMVRDQIEFARLQGKELTEEQALFNILDIVRVAEMKRDFKEVK